MRFPSLRRMIFGAAKPSDNNDGIPPPDQTEGQLPPADQIEDQHPPADQIEDQHPPAGQIEDQLPPGECAACYRPKLRRSVCAGCPLAPYYPTSRMDEFTRIRGTLSVAEMRKIASRCKSANEVYKKMEEQVTKAEIKAIGILNLKEEFDRVAQENETLRKKLEERDSDMASGYQYYTSVRPYYSHNPGAAGSAAHLLAYQPYFPEATYQPGYIPHTPHGAAEPYPEGDVYITQQTQTYYPDAEAGSSTYQPYLVGVGVGVGAGAHTPSISHPNPAARQTLTILPYAQRPLMRPYGAEAEIPFMPYATHSSPGLQMAPGAHMPQMPRPGAQMPMPRPAQMPMPRPAQMPRPGAQMPPPGAQMPMPRPEAQT